MMSALQLPVKQQGGVANKKFQKVHVLAFRDPASTLVQQADTCRRVASILYAAMCTFLKPLASTTTVFLEKH